MDNGFVGLLLLCSRRPFFVRISRNKALSYRQEVIVTEQSHRSAQPAMAAKAVGLVDYQKGSCLVCLLSITRYVLAGMQLIISEAERKISSRQEVNDRSNFLCFFRYQRPEQSDYTSQAISLRGRRWTPKIEMCTRNGIEAGTSWWKIISALAIAEGFRTAHHPD